MSTGGVNNIEDEPLRRASKGELDEVEAGEGSEYHGEEPIVVSGQNIRIEMDGYPTSGSVRPVTSHGILVLRNNLQTSISDLDARKQDVLSWD